MTLATIALAIRTLRVLATAYTPDPGENGGYTTTATGHALKGLIVAVDPKVIPLGSKVKVPGYGDAVARDTGGKIKGLRIDVLMQSKKAARKWGRRWVNVEVSKLGVNVLTHSRKHDCCPMRTL